MRTRSVVTKLTVVASCWGESVSRECPSSRISPPSRSPRPAIARSRVDFPVVVTHAESGLELVLPIFDAVTLAEYLECLDVCLGIVYQYAVHIEQDSPYHFVVF